MALRSNSDTHLYHVNPLKLPSPQRLESLLQKLTNKDRFTTYSYSIQLIMMPHYSIICLFISSDWPSKDFQRLVCWWNYHHHLSLQTHLVKQKTMKTINSTEIENQSLLSTIALGSGAGATAFSSAASFGTSITESRSGAAVGISASALVGTATSINQANKLYATRNYQK